MRLLQVLVPQVEKICIDKWAQSASLKKIAPLFAEPHRCVWLQRLDGRIGDPEVSPARHISGPAAGSSPHPHQKVSAQRGHGHVVPHLHVGRHLFTVS